MKIKRRRKQGISESSAASDVAFLLIIYFIVIAGFNINKGFLLNLPQKDSTRLILREDLLRFDMDEDGKISYEGEIIGIPRVKTIVSEGQKDNPEIAVIITIHADAHWQEVVSFVELVQDLKIESFSFSMNKDSL